MARGKKKEALTPEERLQAALVPESEQPYPVPENWCWVRLLDSFYNYTDSKKKIPQKEYLQDGEIAVVDQGQDLVGGYTNDSEMVFTGNLPVIIFGDHTRCIKYIDFPFAQGADGVKVLKPKQCFDTKAFYYAFQSVNIPNMGYRRHFPLFDQYAIPLPPLAEQQRIVDRIESLFAKLDEAKQRAQDAMDSFETRKAAILHKAFTGALTAQWRKKHDVTMESWETHNLSECFEIVSGIQKTPARAPKENAIPYLAVANVYRDRIDFSDIRYFEVTPEEVEKLKLQDKDILIVEGNGSGNEIGRCAMWHNELPLCVHQNHIIRMRNEMADVLPEYVLYYLNSETGKSIMQERAKTTAGLFNLSAGKVKTIPLPFATLDEQVEIVRILDNLLAKEQQAKEAAEGVMEQIELIKKSILARAFRGELGTNDPNEESAVGVLKQISSC